MGKRWIFPLSLSLSLWGNDDRRASTSCTVRLLRKKERKKRKKVGLVREGGGFWGLDGWRVGGEVGEGGGRALFGGVGGLVGLAGSWLVRKERGNVGVG